MFRGDDEIHLTATEFELLRFLMRNPRRVLSKPQILDRVWNYDFGGQANVVELYISYLRKKIDAGRPAMIHTMRGAGYVLKPVDVTVRRFLPTSLTGRLVATLVAVVVLTTLLVAAVTAARDERLPQQPARPAGRRRPAARASGSLRRPARSDRRPGRTRTATTTATDRVQFGRGDAVGTLNAHVRRVRRTGERRDRRATTAEAVDPALGRAAGRPGRRRAHVVKLPGVGSYRVRPSRRPRFGQAGRRAVHPPGRRHASATWCSPRSLLGLAARRRRRRRRAGSWCAGSSVRCARSRPPRTRSRPCRCPPARSARRSGCRTSSTDERTEVGQVGAALNTLLAHVEHALDERHRSEQQVRQFVADASHELRTPLTTIHGYAELSRRTGPPTPRPLSMAMTKVEAEATRMSSLVEDLLLLARLDAGRPLASRRGRPDPAGPRGRRRRPRRRAATTGGSSTCPTSPSWSPGDEQRLHQVLTNLLNNARRHTPPGTSVTVGVRQDDGPRRAVRPRRRSRPAAAARGHRVRAVHPRRLRAHPRVRRRRVSASPWSRRSPWPTADPCRSTPRRGAPGSRSGCPLRPDPGAHRRPTDTPHGRPSSRSPESAP